MQICMHAGKVVGGEATVEHGDHCSSLRQICVQDGGVAVGDKEHHVSVMHLMQSLSAVQYSNACRRGGGC